MIVINLLLYLLYLLIAIGISSAVANFVGRAKTAEALQDLLHVRQGALSRDPSEEDLLDPALLPFMRPEYSPFAADAQPVPVSPWQQRRLEREALPPGKSTPLAGRSNPLPRSSAPLTGKSNPLPGKSGQPSARDERFAAQRRPPADMRGQPPPPRGQSGKLNPSGVPARGTAPGAAPRRSTPGPRPPSQAQWPRPREKD